MVQFQSHVHINPGIFLIYCMEIDLGIDMKHMFHQVNSSKLIIDAYLDLIRRLR